MYLMAISRCLLVISMSAIISACSSPQVREDRDTSKNMAPENVTGTISLIFSPTVLAKLPQPPIDVSVMLKEKNSGDVTVHRITDTNPVWHLTEQGDGVAIKNFAFTLKSGKYQMQALEVNSKSLGTRMFKVPLFGEPYFTVADDSKCTYVGRINLAFVRLPQGSLDQARRAVHSMANQFNRAFALIYLPMGALVPVGFSVDKPKERESSTDMRSSYRLYKRELGNNCKIELIQF